MFFVFFFPFYYLHNLYSKILESVIIAWGKDSVEKRILLTKNNKRIKYELMAFVVNIKKEIIWTETGYFSLITSEIMRLIYF